jgi:AmiR/NasT family two-component response regulator
MVKAEAAMNRIGEPIQKGATGFVVKPLNADGILDRIKICFKRRE